MGTALRSADAWAKPVPGFDGGSRGAVPTRFRRADDFAHPNALLCGWNLDVIDASIRQWWK